jgi:hypothetical protein
MRAELVEVHEAVGLPAECCAAELAEACWVPFGKLRAHEDKLRAHEDKLRAHEDRRRPHKAPGI